jgi:hypothetical protein
MRANSGVALTDGEGGTHAEKLPPVQDAPFMETQSQCARWRRAECSEEFKIKSGLGKSSLGIGKFKMLRVGANRASIQPGRE